MAYKVKIEAPKSEITNPKSHVPPRPPHRH